MSQERTDLISLRQIMSTNPPTRQWENLLLLIGEDFQTYNPSRLVSAGDVMRIFGLAQGARVVNRFCDEKKLMAAMLPALQRRRAKAGTIAELDAVLDQISRWIDGGDEPDFDGALMSIMRLTNFTQSLGLICARPYRSYAPLISEGEKDRKEDEKQLREILAVFPLHAVPEF